MARKPTEKSNIDQLPDAIPGVDFELPVIPQVSIDELKAQEERDLLNQLLGQVQMAKSFSKFADVVSLSKLKHIKESKLYRTIAGKKGIDLDGNEIADVGTWDGFCQALGLSRSKVDEDLINLNAFGEEALKQLSAVGAGYRELRQFRKLPEDSKTALIEVAKEGDKESLLELAEELIARQNKEKESLEKQLIDKDADLEASRKRAADLKIARDELEEKLHKERFKPISDNELAERYRLEATSISSKIVRELMGSLQAAFTELEKDTTDRNVNHSSFMAGLIGEIRSELDNLITRFDIPDLVAEHTPPTWLSEHNDNNTEEK